LVTGNPALSIQTLRATSDNAVNVNVTPQILSPGVQHHGDADVATDPTRITPELKQGTRGGLKQQVVD